MSRTRAASESLFRRFWPGRLGWPFGSAADSAGDAAQRPPERTWSPAVKIATIAAHREEQTVHGLALRADAAGNALLLWIDGDSDGDLSGGALYAMEGRVGEGWRSPRRLHAHVAEFCLALGRDGAGMALWWGPGPGGFESYQAARYGPQRGWAEPEALTHDRWLCLSYNSGSALAAGPDGEFTALWIDDRARLSRHGESVTVRRFTPGAGWGPEASIQERSQRGRSLCGPPSLAYDADGGALAIWGEERDSRSSVWASRRGAGGGWGPAVRLSEARPMGYLADLHVVAGAAGRAIAAWTEVDGDPARAALHVCLHAPEAGWGAETRLARFARAGGRLGPGPPPALAIDAQGAALAAWGRPLSFSRFSPGGGWSPPAPVPRTADGWVVEGDLGADGSGRVVGVFGHGLPSSRIAASRYEGGWTRPEVLSTNRMQVHQQHEFAFDCRVAVLPDGRAVAVWQQQRLTLSGERAELSLWSSRLE